MTCRMSIITRKSSGSLRKLAIWALFVCLNFAGDCFAEPTQALLLEKIELRGTSRIDAVQISEELGLKRGMPLGDALVSTTRNRLLSLGLFRSVYLYQRKGSAAGNVNLVIEVEEDDAVLTDWALGGLVAVTQDQTASSVRAPSTPTVGARLELLGRNLFSSLHRGGLMADLDSIGILRRARVAYGFPRFAKEDVQFDVEADAVDVRSRYLDALGYGGKVQGLWTQSLAGMDIHYGPAMYVNRSPRFAVPEFPTTIAGPKLGLLKETRLLRFYPSQGYSFGSSLIYAVNDSFRSALEVSAAYTLNLFDFAFITLGSELITVGTEGYSWRGENRFDFPVNSGKKFGNIDIFVRLRAGSDEFDGTHLSGQAGIIGVRYHSSGFIGEFSFKITKAPQEFIDSELKSKPGEAP